MPSWQALDALDLVAYMDMFTVRVQVFSFSEADTSCLLRSDFPMSMRTQLLIFYKAHEESSTAQSHFLSAVRHCNLITANQAYFFKYINNTLAIHTVTSHLNAVGHADLNYTETLSEYAPAFYIISQRNEAAEYLVPSNQQ